MSGGYAQPPVGALLTRQGGHHSDLVSCKSVTNKYYSALVINETYKNKLMSNTHSLLIAFRVQTGSLDVNFDDSWVVGVVHVSLFRIVSISCFGVERSESGETEVYRRTSPVKPLVPRVCKGGTHVVSLSWRRSSVKRFTILS